MTMQANQSRLAGYGCEDVDPRGFVSLMDMYENNYIRLRRLIPDLAKSPGSAISHLPGCLSLHMTVLERTRFTTTIYLTYYFEEATKSVAEPALTIRLYHDAHQAEVLTGHLQHGRQRSSAQLKLRRNGPGALLRYRPATLHANVPFAWQYLQGSYSCGKRAYQDSLLPG